MTGHPPHSYDMIDAAVKDQDGLSDLEKVLAPVIGAFEADGYGVVLTVSERDLVFTIVAEDGACEDCLSPRTVIEPIIAEALQAGEVDLDLTVVYPAEHDA